MTEEQQNYLRDRCDKSSFLLGKMCGGISVILESFQNGLVIEAEENLRKLHSDLLNNINDFFYKPQGENNGEQIKNR